MQLLGIALATALLEPLPEMFSRNVPWREYFRTGSTLRKIQQRKAFSLSSRTTPDMTNSYISEVLDLKALLHFSTTVSGLSIVVQGRHK